MSGHAGFEAAVTEATAVLGPVWLRALAEAIDADRPRDAVLGAVAAPGFAQAAEPVWRAVAAGRPPGPQAAAYLRGVAAGYETRARALRVEPVWSGPGSHAVPVRATAQVLVEVVAQARRELVLMTYSARPYPPLLDALGRAVARGVRVAVVVETLQGAGGALSGAEPAAAFAAVPGVQLWHWPAGGRSQPGAKMHAKLAVADRRVLLVSSANLTQSGVAKNIEAGLLVHGGPAPERAADHLAELQARGTLTPL